LQQTASNDYKPDCLNRDLPTPAAFVLLLLAVAVVFGRLATAEFTLWDDPHTLRDNPSMRQPTLARAIDHWKPITADRAAAGSAVNDRASLWVPLTYFIWTLLAFVARVRNDAGQIELNPYIFHVANIAVHFAAAWLVFSLLRKLTNHAIGALIGAMCFALHPLQVEAVGWTSGMKDLLAGTLAMGSMRCYLSAVDELLARRRRRVNWWCGLSLLALAMLAKPSAVATPLILVAIDKLLLNRSWRAIVLSLAPWFALTLPIVLIARAAQTGGDVPAVPVHLRPAVAADAMTFYLSKLVWPVNLCIDYGRSPAAALNSQALVWTTVIAVFSIAGAILIAVYHSAVASSAKQAAADSPPPGTPGGGRGEGRVARGTNCASALPLTPSRSTGKGNFVAPSVIAAGRLPLAALLIFIAAVLPVLGLVPFTFQNYSTVADHYVYVALLGPSLLIAFLIARKPRRTLIAILSLVILVLGARSFVQTHIWSDSESLFKHTIAVNSGSGAGWNNYGAVLAARGEWRGAADAFWRALPTAPDRATTYVNLRQVLTAAGDYSAAAEVAREEYTYLVNALQEHIGHAWLLPRLPTLRALARNDSPAAIELARQYANAFPRDRDAQALMLVAESLAGKERSN
jgi:hypothetical protein